MSVGDVRLLELALEDARRRLHVLLAVASALGHHRLDLRVLPRVEPLEREVLELPLDRVDAEPVRDRRIDVERLLRLLKLLLPAEVLDRPHVVQAVGELDEDDARILRHRDDHLAVVLDLRVLAARELDARQLRDALDEPRDLVAELALDVRDVASRVLDDVVEERCRQRLLVEMERREDLRRAPRVPDEVLARAAALPLVSPLCERECPAQQVLVDVRLVRGDVRDQLLDEVLVPFLCLDDGHVPSVDGGPNEGSWPNRAFPKGVRGNFAKEDDHAAKTSHESARPGNSPPRPHARRARLARRSSPRVATPRGRAAPARPGARGTPPTRRG